MLLSLFGFLIAEAHWCGQRGSCIRADTVCDGVIKNSNKLKSMGYSAILTGAQNGISVLRACQNGGEGGIRTHDALRHTGFRDLLFQPLTHLSIKSIILKIEFRRMRRK